MTRRSNRYLEPRQGVYLVFLTIFAGITLYFHLILGVIELVCVAGLFFYFYHSSRNRRSEMLRYLESVSANMNLATRDTMLNSPLPMVIFRPDTDEVVWSNDRFLHLADEKEYLFDTRLSEAVPGFDSRWLLEGKSACPNEVAVGSRRFLVFGNLIQAQGKRGRTDQMATTFWVDVTQYTQYRSNYQETRPVAAILMLDNYDEVLKSLNEVERTAILSEFHKVLAAWVAPTEGLFSRFDRDRYLFIFEEKHLPAVIEGKFSILEKVRNIVGDEGMGPTLSIGLGRDAPTMKELLQYATLSLDMALSRGGDQAVVKNAGSFEFYGGHNKEMEKRTKVKSRVMAGALSALMSDSSRVFIMGHKFPDLDCVGAIAGVCAIARKRGIPTYIIKESGNNPATEMVERLANTHEYKDIFRSEEEALAQVDARSLLVVVDTNRPEQVQSLQLLEKCTRVAVIDHHRRAASYIANAALNFHEPYASSASELVTELIQYIMDPSDLLRIEAEAMLAGMVLDTKQFTMRTGSRTFEAAAFLRRNGADTGDVRKLFQNDLAGTIARYEVIRNSIMVHDDVAVAVSQTAVGRVPAAQAADELLNIAGVEASFVLSPDPAGEQVVISARSMGEINVQVILEKLGGGGNSAAAGAQVRDSDVSAVNAQLLEAIEAYFEEE